jgi:hypothetical protein
VSEIFDAQWTNRFQICRRIDGVDKRYILIRFKLKKEKKTMAFLIWFSLPEKDFKFQNSAAAYDKSTAFVTRRSTSRKNASVQL